MPRTYKQLNPNERDILAVLKSKGKSLREIASILKRSPSTLSRELKRNAPPIYTGYYLSTKLKAERRGASSNPISDKGLKTPLSVNMSKNASAWDGLLNLSPEDLPLTTRGSLLAMRPSINGSIRRPPILFCPWSEPIVNRKQRGYSRKHKKSHIPERISIKKRPKTVLKRLHFGHWETDTISCRKPATRPSFGTRYGRTTNLTTTLKDATSLFPHQTSYCVASVAVCRNVSSCLSGRSQPTPSPFYPSP